MHREETWQAVYGRSWLLAPCTLLLSCQVICKLLRASVMVLFACSHGNEVKARLTCTTVQRGKRRAWAALPPDLSLSLTSAWGESAPQKEISLWTTWRQGSCNLKPKSNQSCGNWPAEICCLPCFCLCFSFVCFWPPWGPSQVTSHHPDGHLPLVWAAWFTGQGNLSVWQGVSRT